ncbi:MAG: hypothetical protein C5B49_07340 [Bdellovibrio sp.]|nr:MAG: hypothetical protein C5B49_07340 [Bdellovibrio sp.]
MELLIKQIKTVDPVGTYDAAPEAARYKASAIGHGGRSFILFFDNPGVRELDLLHIVPSN